MATINTFLDKKGAKNYEKASLYMVIRHANTVSSMSTGIRLEPAQWKNGRVIQHPEAAHLNRQILDLEESLRMKAEKIVSVHPTLKARDIRDRLLKMMQNDILKSSPVTIEQLFWQFIELKNKKNTIESFQYTLQTINAFTSASNLFPEEITVQWLTAFERWLLNPSTHSKRQPVKRNTCAIHLENLRAVINYAINEELTENYAFKRFRIKREDSVPRALSGEDMRNLWNYEGRTWTEQWYIDIFKISFCLCGMNVKDMYELTRRDVMSGRIERNRSKTGVHLSIKIEPELQSLLTKYAGKGNNLINIADHYKRDYKDFLSRINRGLKVLGPIGKRVGHGGKIVDRKPLWPELTTYWARHTWATIASDLDVPIEVISMGLGHSYGSTMTNVYIRPNLKKLDEANRKVLDYVTGKTEIGH